MKIETLTNITNTVKTTEERVQDWNQERGLIKTPGELKVANNISFVIEECIEALTDMKSEEARKSALVIADTIRTGNIKQLADIAQEEKLNQGPDIIVPDPEQVIDAAGDMVVFALGLIRKQGYDAGLVMKEVLREIESRKGSIIEGKFTKDKSPEAQALWYKANFKKALIKEIQDDSSK